MLFTFLFIKIKEFFMRHKGRMLITASVFVLCAILMAGCSLFYKTIDLSEYISYKYEGIDGYTSIEVTLDKDGIINDFGAEVNDKYKEAFAAFADTLEIVISKSDNLSNGDEVEISVSYDGELQKTSGVKLKNISRKIIIEGLREGELLDVFADITVNVSGIAPLATASIENKSANGYISSLSYSLDRETGFFNGDMLTVTCNADIDKAEQDGYVILETVRQYSTEGMEYYASEPGHIDMDVLNEVAQDAANTIISQTENSQMRMLYKVTGKSNFLFQYNKEWVESVNLTEARFFVKNNISDSTDEPYNRLYLIFKAYVTNADYGSDAYFCFEYSNIYTKSDKTFYIRHDNEEKRYLCDDDYNELINAVFTDRNADYSESLIDISGIEIYADNTR